MTYSKESISIETKTKIKIRKQYFFKSETSMMLGYNLYYGLSSSRRSIDSDTLRIFMFVKKKSTKLLTSESTVIWCYFWHLMVFALCICILFNYKWVIKINISVSILSVVVPALKMNRGATHFSEGQNPQKVTSFDHFVQQNSSLSVDMLSTDELIMLPIEWNFCILKCCL